MHEHTHRAARRHHRGWSRSTEARRLKNTAHARSLRVQQAQMARQAPTNLLQQIVEPQPSQPLQPQHYAARPHQLISLLHRTLALAHANALRLGTVAQVGEPRVPKGLPLERPVTFEHTGSVSLAALTLLELRLAATPPPP